jgi:hypothetical protein
MKYYSRVIHGEETPSDVWEIENEIAQRIDVVPRTWGLTARNLERTCLPLCANGFRGQIFMNSKRSQANISHAWRAQVRALRPTAPGIVLIRATNLCTRAPQARVSYTRSSDNSNKSAGLCTLGEAAINKHSGTRFETS